MTAEFEVEKNDGLTSCGVCARWCLGQSPTSFGDGRPLWEVPAGESTPWSRHFHDAARTSTSTVRLAVPGTLPSPARHAGLMAYALRELIKPVSLKDTLRPEAPVSSTVKVPALCPCEEWRLHHSPSVVAGGSSDDAR